MPLVNYLVSELEILYQYDYVKGCCQSFDTLFDYCYEVKTQLNKENAKSTTINSLFGNTFEEESTTLKPIVQLSRVEDILNLSKIQPALLFKEYQFGNLIFISSDSPYMTLSMMKEQTNTVGLN